MDTTFKEALAKSVIETARETFEYEEEKHPRDSNGRWTGGGTDEGKKAETANTAMRHLAAEQYHKDAAAFHHSVGGQGSNYTAADAKAKDAHKVAAMKHGEAAYRMTGGGRTYNVGDSLNAHDASKAAHAASAAANAKSKDRTRHLAIRPVGARGDVDPRFSKPLPFGAAIVAAAREVFEYDEGKHPRGPDGKSWKDKTKTFRKWGAEGAVNDAASQKFAPAFRKALVESARQTFFSEEQARDENGRWTSAGSSEGRDAERAASPGTHDMAAAFHRDAAEFHKGKDTVAASAHTVAAKAHASAAEDMKHAESHPGSVLSDEGSRFAREASGDALIASHLALKDVKTGNAHTDKVLAAEHALRHTTEAEVRAARAEKRHPRSGQWKP